MKGLEETRSEPDDPDRARGAAPDGSRSRRGFLLGASAAVALGAAGTASAQSNSDGTNAADSGDGSGVLVTAVGLGLTAAALAGVYLVSWRDRPEPSFRPEPRSDDAAPQSHVDPMYEADVAASELEAVDHDGFDPSGTATLLAGYFAVIALLWLFMYFVEFLGNGPTVVG